MTFSFTVSDLVLCYVMLYQISWGITEIPKTHRILDPALGGGALLDL